MSVSIIQSLLVALSKLKPEELSQTARSVRRLSLADDRIDQELATGLACALEGLAKAGALDGAAKTLADQNNPSRASSALEWSAGFEAGRVVALAGARLPSDVDPKRYRDKGAVAGWRLQNAMQDKPLSDSYDDGVWGDALSLTRP